MVKVEGHDFVNNAHHLRGDNNMNISTMYDIVNKKERNIHVSLRTTKTEICDELISKFVKLRKITRLIQQQIRDLEGGYQIIE